MNYYFIGPALVASVCSISEGPPRLNIERHCRAIAELAEPLAIFDSCIRREQEAYETIIRKWKELDPADRAHCARLATLGDADATYTSLLTCLEIEEHVRKLRGRKQRG